MARGLQGIVGNHLDQSHPLKLNLYCSFIIFFLLKFILQGLIVSSRKENLQHFKQPWAHEHEPVKDLIGAVNVRHELIFKSLDGC